MTESMIDFFKYFYEKSYLKKKLRGMNKMAVWEWILIILLVIKLILIVVTLISPPRFIKKWVVDRFELHPQLDEAFVTVTRNGQILKTQDKIQIIKLFNNAIFLKKYDVLPYENERNSVVITVDKAHKRLNYYLYIYETRVDVIKHNKNKVTAYYLRSEQLQEQFGGISKSQLLI